VIGLSGLDRAAIESAIRDALAPAQAAE